MGIGIKAAEELAYWSGRREAEGKLSHAHYAYFYTKHFGWDPSFYRGKKILDIGCGPRGSLEWAESAAQRIGLDPLAHIYRELGTGEHKMEYVAGRSECIPFPQECFDVVASFNSLDHVDDLDQTIHEIKRVLKQRGFFLLLTELNHPPTTCEPVTFSWDIVDKFTDRLTLFECSHYEGSASGMYDGILAGILYDHADARGRHGILSARFAKMCR